MSSDFNGCPYPITPTSKGFLAKQTGINQIKADLLSLLLTNPGERVMLPEFGTPLDRLIYEQNDSILASQAKSVIADSIRTWEPRIVIQSITTQTGVNDSPDDSSGSHVLYISIAFYDPETIKEVQELKLAVPLAGA